jgi:hypothetical protein
MKVPMIEIPVFANFYLTPKYEVRMEVLDVDRNICKAYNFFDYAGTKRLYYNVPKILLGVGKRKDFAEELEPITLTTLKDLEPKVNRAEDVAFHMKKGWIQNNLTGGMSVAVVFSFLVRKINDHKEYLTCLDKIVAYKAEVQENDSKIVSLLSSCPEIEDMVIS